MLNERYGYIIHVLNNWKLYSESLEELDRINLYTLYDAFEVLNLNEERYLYDVYFLGMSFLKEFSDSYQISYLDILEKMTKAIENHMEYINYIDKLKEKKAIERRRRRRRALAKVLMNEAKTYLTPLKDLNGPVVDQWEYIIPIEKIIDELQAFKHRYVLKARYISNQFMKEISIDLKCDIRKVSKIHDEALKEFAEILRREKEGYQNE
ncbi:hypothetical protein [Desemzia sp. FAM 24101]|uniref:hypothetical protein n=1 Tax=unclassified Desemzia TaxID=2685243 RepID=UPI003890196F